MTRKKSSRKKYGPLPSKIAESDIVSLGYGLCASDGSIYNKDNSQDKIFAWNHDDTSSNILQAGLKLSKPQIRQ
jgi:hypothetical protein